MRAIRLALALIRIPQLFASLLLFPMLLGLILVYGQLIVTGLLIHATKKNSNSAEQTFKEQKKLNVGRRLLYGDAHELPPLRICRWRMLYDPSGNYVETVSDPACLADRLDAALIVADPETFDPAPYQSIFEGNIERLHICKSCHPDLVINLTGKTPETHIFSFWGAIVLSLLNYNQQANQDYVKVLKNFEGIKALVGSPMFHARGFAEPIRIGRLASGTALILNVAGLVIITLWLGLRAHRKVLDYFARNGALLPMVAMTGKGSFYSAIWLLTLLRVAAFLMAALPLTYLGFQDVAGYDAKLIFFSRNRLMMVFWIIALVSSLGLATLIGSVAELKHRYQIFSILYRYVPLVVCGFGTLVWASTFLFDGSFAALVRAGCAVVPIFGITPILIAPLFRPPLDILIVHTVLTSILLIVALRYNARWFAAHLEDL